MFTNYIRNKKGMGKMKNKKIRQFDFIEIDFPLNLLNSFQYLKERDYKRKIEQMNCFSFKTRGYFTLPENKSSCKVDQEVYIKLLHLDLPPDNRLPRGCPNRLDKDVWLKHPLRPISPKMNLYGNSIILNPHIKKNRS